MRLEADLLRHLPQLPGSSGVGSQPGGQSCDKLANAEIYSSACKQLHQRRSELAEAPGRTGSSECCRRRRKRSATLIGISAFTSLTHRLMLEINDDIR